MLFAEKRRLIIIMVIKNPPSVFRRASSYFTFIEGLRPYLISAKYTTTTAASAMRYQPKPSKL